MIQHRCNFQVELYVPKQYLFIRDLCETDGSMSITNGAEDVVSWLYENDKLHEGECLFYEDTEGRVDELLHKNGIFVGFQAGWDSVQAFTEAHKISK